MARRCSILYICFLLGDLVRYSRWVWYPGEIGNANKKCVRM